MRGGEGEGETEESEVVQSISPLSSPLSFFSSFSVSLSSLPTYSHGYLQQLLFFY